MEYVGTDLVIICYSVTSQQSFNDITEKWIPEIRRYSTALPFVLVGLKADERKKQPKHGNRESVDSLGSLDSYDDDVMPWVATYYEELEFVDKKAAKKLAKSCGALAYVECSALNGQGVHMLFENTIPRVLEEYGIKKHKKKSSLVRKLGRFFNGKKESKENLDHLETESSWSNLETQSTRSSHSTRST